MLWMLFGLVAVIDTAVLSDLAPHEITFLIITQKDPLNLRYGHKLRDEILQQSTSQHHQPPLILLTNEHFPDTAGAWAVTPLLISTANGNTLLETVADDVGATSAAKWLVVCDAHSHVDLSLLTRRLRLENHTEDKFLGHGLHDQEATIVHHFAFFDNPTGFSYPSFRAGIALSWPLVKRLGRRTVASAKFTSEFAIDAAHELAMFIWDEGHGHKLTEASYLCLVPDGMTAVASWQDGTGGESTARPKDEERLDGSRIVEKKEGEVEMEADAERGCAVYGLNDDDEDYEDNAGVTSEATCDTTQTSNILFAVKTCSLFHAERVPVIQNTWAKEVEHIRYYSDVNDPTIPTIVTGVPNTETGHCQKMLAIFQLLLREIDDDRLSTKLAHIDWIVLADDDTLLSIAELTGFLLQYNSSDDTYIGERYGFRLFARDGLNYITGGGGIVFSVNVIRRLSTTCECPTDSAPDDMILGVCMRQLGIEPIHSERFHQARPSDYSAALLASSPRPISFHKYWQIDPYAVYSNWLSPTANRRRHSTRNCISKTPSVGHRPHPIVVNKCLNTQTHSTMGVQTKLASTTPTTNKPTTIHTIKSKTKLIIKNQEL